LSCIVAGSVGSQPSLLVASDKPEFNTASTALIGGVCIKISKFSSPPSSEEAICFSGATLPKGKVRWYLISFESKLGGKTAQASSCRNKQSPTNCATVGEVYTRSSCSLT